MCIRDRSLSARLLVCGAEVFFDVRESVLKLPRGHDAQGQPCLLYTSDAADERSSVDLGGRRIIKKKRK